MMERDLSLYKKDGITRKPIPDGVRNAVFSRDGYACRFCGFKRTDGAKLHIDHIQPISKGGTNDISNLQALCRDCNIGKGNLVD